MEVVMEMEKTEWTHIFTYKRTHAHTHINTHTQGMEWYSIATDFH